MKQAIAFRAAEHVNDFLPMSRRDIIKFEGPQLAWQRALKSRTLLDLLDLSFVESHDCFTSAELIEYEAMGLTAPGEGERAIHGAGWSATASCRSTSRVASRPGPSGRRHRRQHARDVGHAALGHRAGGPATAKAKLGGVFNMGGAAIANYVSILEPLR